MSYRIQYIPSGQVPAVVYCRPTSKLAMC